MAATPINKLPLGLLGFLGIKNGGEYPRELVPYLQGTWDLAGLYTAANSEVTQATNAAISSVGFQSYFTVPNGEIWRVLDLSAGSSTLAAGQTMQLGLGITDPAGTTTVLIQSPSDPATTAGRAYVALDHPEYVGPGYTIGIVASQVVAGPVSVTVGMRFARFQI